MKKKYNSLQTLISSDLEANRYFNALPSHIKEQISSRGDNVNSMESLKDYADNLLRGDI